MERQRPVERLPRFRHSTVLQKGLRRLDRVARCRAAHVGIVERPLHRIERIEQHRLARRFAEFDRGLFVGRDQNAAVRIAEFNQAINDRQLRRIVRMNRQIKLGAANGGGGGYGLDVQRFAAVAHPDFTVQHLQHAAQHLAGSGQKALGRRRDLLELHLTAGIQLELGAAA